MPTGMSERLARALAAQIEAEDERVRTIVQRCASENRGTRAKRGKWLLCFQIGISSSVVINRNIGHLLSRPGMSCRRKVP